MRLPVQLQRAMAAEAEAAREARAKVSNFKYTFDLNNLKTLKLFNVEGVSFSNRLKCQFSR